MKKWALSNIFDDIFNFCMCCVELVSRKMNMNSIVLPGVPCLKNLQNNQYLILNIYCNIICNGKSIKCTLFYTYAIAFTSLYFRKISI